MISGPRTQISPCSPRATDSPDPGSTTTHSVFGSSVPPEVGLILPGAQDPTWVAPETSVMPYAWISCVPRRAVKASAAGPPSGAAAERAHLALDRSYLSTMGCLARAITTGGTRCRYVTP